MFFNATIAFSTTKANSVLQGGGMMELPCPVDSGTAASTDYQYGCYMRVSINGGTPKMDGSYGKIPLKWMIWWYPYFRKPPYVWVYDYP